MDPVKAIRLIALKNALIPEERDAEANWRFLTRWYSRTYATPLHEVVNLPKLDILQVYYENFYENAEEAELHNELQELLKPDNAVDRALAKSKDEVGMEQLMTETQEQNKKAKTKPEAKPTKKPLTPGKFNKASKQMIDAVDKLGKAITDIKKVVEPVTPGCEFQMNFDDLKDL